jgi:hypothetical protein
LRCYYTSVSSESPSPVGGGVVRKAVWHFWRESANLEVLQLHLFLKYHITSMGIVLFLLWTSPTPSSLISIVNFSHFLLKPFDITWLIEISPNVKGVESRFSMTRSVIPDRSRLKALKIHPPARLILNCLICFFHWQITECFVRDVILNKVDRLSSICFLQWFALFYRS